MLLTYAQFKDICSAKEIWRTVQYNSFMINDDNYYTLRAYDGPEKYTCDITGADLIDFETNYKSNSNLPIDVREKYTGLVQVKPRPVEATLFCEFVYFTTGDPDSLDAPNEFWYIDTSVPGITKVGAVPNFNYYVDGGGYTLIGAKPAGFNVKMTFRMAPQIPAQYGGNIYLVNGKKLLKDNDTFILEVPPKFVKYYSENPYASEIQLLIEHGTSDALSFELYVRFYK